MKQKLKLVLLSTDNKSDISLGIRKLDKPLLNYHKGLQYDATNDKNIINQHLYAVNNEKPKAGDWVLHWQGVEHPAGNFIFKCLKSDDYDKTHGIHDKDTNYLREHCFKIFITTDESLLIDYKGFEHGTARKYEAKVYLPTFTNDFINTYINEYNKGNIIEEIEVEYESRHTGWTEDQSEYTYDNFLKINPDNTVNASLIAKHQVCGGKVNRSFEEDLFAGDDIEVFVCDKCKAVTHNPGYNGGNQRYCSYSYPVNKINLKDLEQKIDNAIAKETSKSLTEWINSKRNKLYTKEEVIELVDNLYLEEYYDKYLNELLDINGNTTDNIFSESKVGKNWIDKNL